MIVLFWYMLLVVVDNIWNCLVSSGSLFTNSNWFAFENDRVNSERLTDSLASPSPTDEETGAVSSSSSDEVNTSDDLDDTASSQVPEIESKTHESTAESPLPAEEVKQGATSEQNEWVEWRETSNSSNISEEPDKQGEVPNEVEESGNKVEESDAVTSELSSPTIEAPETEVASQDVGLPQLMGELGETEIIVAPLSSSSPDDTQDEVNSSGEEQQPKPKVDDEKTDLVQAEN